MNKAEFTNRVQAWQKRASETARNLGQTTDHYVRENTWSTLAVAVILGCIVGYLVSGSRSEEED